MWRGPAGVKIPPTVMSVDGIVPLAVTLKPAERSRVVSALQSGFYEMGAEFVWRRAMTQLRSAMSNLGPEFLAEMTRREELTSASSIENHLTDYDTIQLSEALGIVNATGALRLRQAFDVVNHFASGKSDEEEMSALDALQIIKACVQYALGEEDIGVAVDFATFRNRLLSEPLNISDQQVEQFVHQPPFFLSTALRVLLAAIRRDSGARQQHALSNLGTLLPLIWHKLPESERWSVGALYAEASTSGASNLILDLKRTLLSVKGFDYVPESLRSNTFRKAAQAVIETHFALNNFYHEVPAVQQLASLGTVIPKPAVADCIRAYFCVYLGNFYGASFGGAPLAFTELTRIPGAYWEYYFTYVLKDDSMILEKLRQPKPRSRFIGCMETLTIPVLSKYPKDVGTLLEAAKANKPAVVEAMASKLLAQYKPLQ
jgi:hypothetical protein